MAETPTYAFANLLLPPFSLVLLTLLGLALIRRRRRIGWTLAILSQCLLLSLSMPVVALWLTRTLEPAPLAPGAINHAQAIVILGGGRNRGALEYGGESLNTFSLQRLRYGARLARETGLPVMVTGGSPDGGTFTEGALMRDALEREFRVPVRWTDQAADDTRGNAKAAALELKPLGMTHIALVTDAGHMPRARRSFEREGFTVIAAPTGYMGQRTFNAYQWVPAADALRLSQGALREYLAQAWYWLRETLA